MSTVKPMKWTPERVDTLSRYWAEGLTGEEIGELMGVTSQSVRGAARAYGLPDRRRGRKPAPRERQMSLPEKRAMPTLLCAPGWPTKAQLMGRR